MPTDLQLVLLLVSFLTLVVAATGATYSYRSDQRKSGVEFRGSYAVTSTVEAEDQYVSMVTLQNMKDRPTAIHAIYLNVGHGQYLQLDDFTTSPLIVGPFCTYSKEYDLVDLYMMGLSRARLNSVLDRGRRRNQLVLSTDRGQYVVTKDIRSWGPMHDVFKNHFTQEFRPFRTDYEGHVYGSNTKFLIKFTTAGGKEQVVPILPNDYQIRKFRGFNLTRAALQSREALEKFLKALAAAGQINCSEVTVLDLESRRREIYENRTRQIADITPQGPFMYYVVGPVFTGWQTLKFRWRNRRAGRMDSGSKGKPKA